jgi:CheY-like chemotaxis protein
VVEANADIAKAVCALLRRWGIKGKVISDGGRALLEMHRKRPDLALLGARLPGLSAPAIAEILRRNADLQEVPLVRFVCDEERAEAPEFDADHTLDPGDLPEALAPVLEQLGVGQQPGAGAAPAPPAAPAPAPASKPAAASAPAAAPSAPARPAAPASGSDDPNIKAAERLARIVISDIILYNEEKFAEAATAKNAPEALSAELNEARSMFNDRVSEELRSQRDFLVEELERRAEKKRARS